MQKFYTDKSILNTDFKEGDLVHLTGILQRNDAGHLVVKLDNKLTFRCDDLVEGAITFEIEEVGLTGVNNPIDIDKLLGNRVIVNGDAMAAHTQYHYSPVMILDGYESLKIIEN